MGSTSGKKFGFMVWTCKSTEARGVVIEDVIMHKVDELKVSFGISGTDFKLSHGWLHKFKT